MLRFSLLLCLLLVSSTGYAQGHSDVVPIIRISPQYPAEAIEKKLNGWVKIKFEITASGSVENPVVVAAEPKKVFDRAAIEALLKFKFKPKVVDGKAVKVDATQTIEFTLPEVTETSKNINFSALDQNHLKYELKSYKDKKVYHNSLAVIDTRTNNTLKQIKLPNTVFDAGFLSQNTHNPHLFFYHATNKKQGGILIIDKKNLEVVHALKTDPIVITTFNNKNYYFFTVTENKLLAYLGSKRKPSLHQIDGLSGLVTKKVDFPKHTYLDRDRKNEVLWSQNSRQSTTNNILKFYHTNSLEVFREIKIKHKMVSSQSWENSVIMIFDYKKESPRYRVRTLNTTSNTFLDDFYTSVIPKVHFIGDELYYIGNSGGSSNHLKIVKHNNYVLSDLTNPNIKLSFNQGDFFNYDGALHFMAYGDQRVAKINLTDTSKFQLIKQPLKATAAKVDLINDRAFLTADNDASIALVDFKNNRFVTEQNTGSKGKKVGQFLSSVLVTAITAPTGVAVTPLYGFSRSNNSLYLNDDKTRLFAINHKTNDVTSFNADDLSDKHIVNTGKQTIQLVQDTREPGLPVVSIGMKKLTYMNANDGRMIKQISYDKPINITDNNELVYVVDGQVQQQSLAYFVE